MGTKAFRVMSLRVSVYAMQTFTPDIRSQKDRFTCVSWTLTYAHQTKLGLDTGAQIQMKNNIYKKLSTITLYVLISLSYSCQVDSESECNFDTYEANCSDGQAHNCSRTTSEGDEWVINVDPCGSTISDGSSHGPKCLILSRSISNKPYAICSFDETPETHCEFNYSSTEICVNKEHYSCFLGIRRYKNPNKNHQCTD